MAINFANVDFTNRAAVEKLLEATTKEARAAWSAAAQAANALEARALSAPPPVGHDALAALGSITAMVAEANLSIAKTQARLVNDFLVAGLAAFEAATATSAAVQDEFNKALEDIDHIGKALKELEPGDESSSAVPPKRRAAA